MGRSAVKKQKAQKDAKARLHFEEARAAKREVQSIRISTRRQADAAIRIQAYARMRAVQHKVDSIRRAARLANKLVRGFLARRGVRKLQQARSEEAERQALPALLLNKEQASKEPLKPAAGAPQAAAEEPPPERIQEAPLLRT
ncbi:unnamed protein product, partial [Symbiodinium microadriaticum]